MSDETVISSIIFVCSVILLWAFNNHHSVQYNNYSYLSNALLHGRLDIPNMPLYLEQVTFAGKTYMHFAPGPSVLLLPFIGAFGMGFDIAYLSYILGAAGCVVFYNILVRLEIGVLNTRIWLTALYGFGTVHFFLAALGNSWFLGHVSAALFLLLAVMISLKKDSPHPWLNLFAAGFSFAFAVACRMPVLLAFPLFIAIIVFHRKSGFKGLLAFACGALIPGGLYMIYNYLRYGTVMDLGYYLTFAKDKPEESGGPLQIKYIGYNLYSLFFLPPSWQGTFPYIYPSLNGLAVTFTTPAVFYALKAKAPKYLLVGLWMAIIFTAIPFAMNYGNGMAQFGMRYSMDFLPLIMILVSLGMAGMNDGKLSGLQKTLILLCIFVNGWGAVIWNMGLQKF